MSGSAPLPCATIDRAIVQSGTTFARIAGEEIRKLRIREIRGQRRSMGNGNTKDSARDRLAGLIAAVGAGQDRDAFHALFEYFAPRLKSFMHRQGTDADMAEEIVQETMVNVWRKAEQFDPSKASAATWIFTIARNLRVDLLRTMNRPTPDMNDPAMVPDPEPKPHEVISREQESTRLKTAIAKLPKEQQDVLQLAFFEEKAHPEVARALGIPLGTVKSRIRLAFRHIRAELGENR
jgi:RNA polymerase sigma-70 factor (ECF subfamily)